eukprot:1159680-Pelagomonas_calceolata.AAC.5
MPVLGRLTLLCSLVRVDKEGQPSLPRGLKEALVGSKYPLWPSLPPCQTFSTQPMHSTWSSGWKYRMKRQTMEILKSYWCLEASPCSANLRWDMG